MINHALSFTLRAFLLDLFSKMLPLKTNFVLKIALLLIVFSSCQNTNYATQDVKQTKDSISIWINASKNKEFTDEIKLMSLKKAYNRILTLDSDSLKPSQLSSIAYRFFQLKDTINFFKANERTLNLALKLKDSFTIADAHWSYADYYITGESYEKAYPHYRVAYQYFNGLNKVYHSGRMLYSMAFIKGRYRDFSGSEVLNIEAIKKFDKLKNYRWLYESYNHLAVLQNDIYEYDKAIVYQEKALEILSKMENKRNFYSWSLNNLGRVYFLKKDYPKAQEYFNKALEENNKNDKRNKATILDNIAYCNLKMNNIIDVEKDLIFALHIRDSINNKAGIVSNKIHLSEYYSVVQDTAKSVKHAMDALNLAMEIKNGRDYLKSLALLSKVDSKNSELHLTEYIRFNDSLITSERKTLNKFTRIEFETDEIIETNEILTRQRIWIFSASIVLILILSLLYFIRVQRAKNEKLFLETEQQKANEQVYLLTLKQQANLEEEKTKERNRISQELHDGILGRLFGTRVGLGFLDLNADEQTQEQHEAFLEELQDIEKEIREVSHKLNDNFASPDVNFTTIVTQLLESKSEIGEFQFHLNIDENISWKSTDEIIKVNVYRIIQETLQNTIKHAQAKNVTLDFSSNEKELSVVIEDDGVGFNQKKSTKGIGLKNMKSRIEKLNGILEINSALNKGTQIHIKIPIV